MKLTEQAQARIRRCVDNLIDEKTGMSKGQIYGYCTNLEKAGKLDDSGHWAKEMAESEMIEALRFSDESETVDIDNVELFRSGNWVDGRGLQSSYSADDIRRMVTQRERLGFLPPIKLGHDKQDEFAQSLTEHTGLKFPRGQGLPSLGYAIPTHTKTNPDGSESLFGSLKSIPKKAAILIRNYFKNRSSEILNKVRLSDGTEIRNAFGGVALLGMTTPVLKELASAYGDQCEPATYSDNSNDVISINFSEFTADSQEHSHEDTEAAPVGDGSNVNSNQRKESSRVENFKQFATKEEYDAHVAALKADLVPKSELDALKQRQEQSEQASYFAEIDTKVAGLIKPNEHGKSLPVFVKDKLSPVLKTIPRTSQFGEAGKEVPVIDAIVSIFAEVSKVGLADYRETTGTSGSDHADTSKEAELRKEFRESKELFADISITEDQYVAIHMRS